MSAVRPELGPSLPELLGPRVRSWPRPVQLALAVLGALLALLLLWALLLRGDPPATAKRSVIVRQPIAFNFVYRSPFHKLDHGPSELAKVGSEKSGQSFAVRELRLPAYHGDAAGFLPLYASQQHDAMAKVFPGFRWRTDGRANINKQQGYEIVFQYRSGGGELLYGRRVLLLPSVTARQGVDLLLLAPRSPAVVRADDAGKNGGLKTALRSFRFGTDRP